MTIRCSIRSLAGLVLQAALLATVVGKAAADPLTLTPTGIADGFTLTTFATVDPQNAGTFNLGPFGVAVASNGNVIVGNNPGANDDFNSQGTRLVFADVDGQTLASALNAITPGGVLHQAYATAGGQAYGAVDRQLVEFNSDGTVNHVLTGVTTLMTLGMWGNPGNGHILAFSDGGLIDINPLASGGAGSFRVVNSQVTGSALTISADGTTVYAVTGSGINSIDIATGAEGFVASLSNHPLGIGAILSSNDLNGDLVVNGAAGEVDLVDPSTGTITVIATGGSRGGYVSPDPSNGTLFVDQSVVIDRLGCAGCSIGPTVPEPSTWGLLACALAVGLGLLPRGRKAVH